VTIKVLIADDHRVVAEGLRSLIETQPDMEVVGLAGNGVDAVRRSLEIEPDVIVMDNAMPLMNGTEAARIITKKSARTRVVMLSMHSNTVHVYRALQAGSTGYVVKQSVANELLDAIRTVHSGRQYFSKPLADALLEWIVSNVSDDPLSLLSARERRVLQLVVQGDSSAKIAAIVDLFPKTVGTLSGCSSGSPDAPL
jgi:DNA-binding NarL/FixJ family response regulator